MKRSGIFVGLLLGVIELTAAPGEPLTLHTRRRVETTPGSGRFQPIEKTVEWDPRKTAIIICDMWNQHWCKGATERVGELAPRINEVIQVARRRGVFIIHAPSDTMNFYKDTPPRRRAQQAPVAKPLVPIKGWCSLDASKEAPLPIDDSDGGCDDWPKCAGGGPWKRQIATIEIADEDAITDSAEAYNLLQQRGIDHVIVMGVHLNMCVLGRPFAIRQLVGQGKEVVLARDLTDTMYNSRSRPYVSHFQGTDLMVEHVEKYWCSSITSVDFVGGQPVRFSKDTQPHDAPPKPPPVKEETKPIVPKQTGALTPAKSLQGFRIAPDLEIEQLLTEPLIAQPVFLNFDERGRLWVVEYRQYPWPAGLKMVSHDSVWRAVYDKVPPPPPHHFPGLDRITIHEDTDGDGAFDKHTTFVEGLNIATAVARGRGGVWVLNPPYLLFYPDKNNDDIPDGDPVVHLSGFGLEDTHSVANSLRWGPDGWLYAAQGSTVTASVIRPGLDKEPVHSMGQLIWRYHPETHRYEVFAEGGGNAFGVELDPQGRIFSGHNGGNTRGFHYQQGAYLQKGFEKHGPLSNPYAFGYFPPMPHPAVERFTHNFIIYDGGALPSSHQGKLFGVEPLQGRIVESEIQPDQSSFKTADLGHPVTTTDSWFRPVDIKVGPDGAIYIADWYDQQVNHYRNHEGKMDPKNGRIYRLKAKGAKRPPATDLSRLTSAQLVETLGHKNEWFRQTALRLLADRKDPTVMPALNRLLENGTGQGNLEALWGIYLSGGFDEARALRTLDHPDPFVRLWTVRLLGDKKRVSTSIAQKLIRMARTEPNLEARGQLACSARRLPGHDGLEIVHGLLTQDADAGDNRMPLLLWWAIEAKAESDREIILSWFEDSPLWRRPLVERHILERLMRRYAQAGSRQDLLTCARLFELSPTTQASARLMTGFEAAYKGRPLTGLPDELVKAMARHGVASLALSLRQGQPGSLEKALRIIADEKGEARPRLECVQVLGEIKQPSSVPVLLGVIARAGNATLRQAGLTALQQYDDPQIGAQVVALYPSFTNDLRTVAQTLLTSRPAWAWQLVQAVEAGKIPADTVPLNMVRKIKLLKDPRLVALAEKQWGQAGSPTTAEMELKIKHLAEVVQASTGDPYNGQKMFNATCAACHKLFSQGGAIGPDLTTYKRDELDTILLNIVNPNAEIREGFENYVVETADDRTLNGFLVEKDARVIVLRGLDGQNVTLERKEIRELKPAGLSLMPEGLLDAFNDQQVRDLFAYLRSTQPLVR